MKKKIVLFLMVLIFLPLTVNADSTWELAKSSITVGVGCKVDIPLKLSNATGNINYIIGDSSILKITGIDNEQGQIEFFDSAGEDQVASSKGKINTLKEGSTTITINAANLGTCNGKGAECAEKENVVDSSLNGQSKTLTVIVSKNVSCEVNEEPSTPAGNNTANVVNNTTSGENKDNPETGGFLGISIVFIGMIGVLALTYSKKQSRF